MYDAIMRQPAAMDEMLSKQGGAVQPVAAELARKRRVYLAGIGTSWHAGLVAGHWFRKFAGAAGPVIEVRHSFEFCTYPPPLNGDDGVIVISHRGTKTYSYLALEMGESSGAYTVAITSTDPGPNLASALPPAGAHWHTAADGGSKAAERALARQTGADIIPLRFPRTRGDSPGRRRSPSATPRFAPHTRG